MTGSYLGPSAKKRGCRTCRKFQYYGENYEGGLWGECRAHPPLRCCDYNNGINPRFNNWPQIDLSAAGIGPGGEEADWWCNEWVRNTGEKDIPKPSLPG